MSDERTVVGTVTTIPSDKGLDLIASLNDEYELVVDGVHGDGNVTFAIKETNDD